VKSDTDDSFLTLYEMHAKRRGGLLIWTLG
jgi:hypothetical protein